jgi:DNA primase
MPPLPLEDARDHIRSRLNLVDVVQQHVRLRKQGREWYGLCPFHQEKTPSFHVNEQKQSWYCFGCEKGGDIFEFVELIEKIDFAGALRLLAEQAGVELAERGGASQERAQLRRRLLELNKLASQYYEYVLRELPAGEPGRELLARRQVSMETAARFGLGFAPGGGSFAAFVHKRGLRLADAGTAGLVRRGQQDFFQQRLMVPIRDERGQTVAFTGRTVLDGEPRKYVNTPETPAYVKGRVLFGLDLARAEIEKRGHAVLMEGQFDVIVAHQHGVGNAIASSGTALTADQLTLMRRFTDEVVLTFDNDAAGKRATARAVELAQELNVRTRVVRLTGEAKDPDEFLRQGGRWEEVLKAAQPGWERLIRDAVADLNSHRPADREVGIGRIRTLLGQITDPAERETYAEVAGQIFEVQAGLLVTPDSPPRSRGSTPRSGGRGAGEGTEGGTLAAGRGPSRLSKRAAYLIQVLAVRPEAMGRVLGILDPADLSEDDRAAYERVVEALKRGGLDALGQALGEFPAEEQDLVRRAWAVPPPAVNDEAVEDLVRHLRREAVLRRHREFQRQLTEAERRGDRALALALEAQVRELSEHIPETKVG